APAEPCQSKSGRAPSHTKHRPPEAVQPATQIPTGRVREVTIGEFVVFARQQAIDETKTLLRTFAMATATARLNTNQPVRLGLTHSTPSGSAVSRSGQAPNPMATFSAHTASPPPPRRTPAGSRASS